MHATKALGLTCLLVTLAAMAVPATASAAEQAFPAVADTYVSASAPATNFGRATTLRTDGSPIETTYLRFDLGQAFAGSAAVRLYATTSTTTPFQVRGVANSTWGETTLTYATAPPAGPVVTTSGEVTAGRWYTLDVSSLVQANGIVSLAVTTGGSKATLIASRESANPPQIVTPAPPSPSPFVIRPDIAGFRAESRTTAAVYTGTLKSVVENAAWELNRHGGGVVEFPAGTYDLGTSNFELLDLVKVTFAGAGIDRTIIRNSSDAAADVEPFDILRADGAVIRDMTVIAGGTPRTSSDAIDFDAGNRTLIERVKISGSRGRGVVFDGKDVMGGIPMTADDNVVRDCVISGVPGDGIEFLASSRNRVEGCTITGPGRAGIQMAISSASAGQPNKGSSQNTVAANVIRGAGEDGIYVLGGSRNALTGNSVLDSSRLIAGRDGIRIATANGVPCEENAVTGNIVTDQQAVKTQRYGVRVGTSCARNLITANRLEGNVSGSLLDQGTGTLLAGEPAAGVPRDALVFEPLADGYVNADNPAGRYGFASTLRVDAVPEMRSYLRFDIRGLDGKTVHRATLRASASGASTAGHQVRAVADTTWTESALSFASAPALGVTVGASGRFVAGAQAAAVVTPAVSADGPLSLALTGTSAAGIGYASRQTATPPRLVVEPDP